MIKDNSRNVQVFLSPVLRTAGWNKQVFMRIYLQLFFT